MGIVAWKNLFYDRVRLIVTLTGIVFALVLIAIQFGTLKAMGATNGQIYQVIILQSTLAAVMGYVLGISVALAIVHSTADTDLLIKLPWPVALGIFGLTLFMCMSASLLSIRKATTIDPAMVFRG
ncbi:MAG: FtsX-like permease family protein [Acidobacteriota bacterium]